MPSRIPLTRGLFALVDDEDHAELSQFNWQAQPRRGAAGRFSAQRTERSDGRKRTIQMHRQILGATRGVEVDHRNHDPLDNTRSNLRTATRAQNTRNRVSPNQRQGGFKGVSWWKRGQKWKAYIRVENEYIHLGYFRDAEAAAKAYDAMALKHWGEFASLNFPIGRAA